MKKFSEMTDEELIHYFVERRRNGISSRDLITSLSRLDVSSSQKKMVIECLEKEDKVIDAQNEKDGRKAKKIQSLLCIIGGIALLFIGLRMYIVTTTQAERVYGLNIALFGAGVTLLGIGIGGLISSFRK
ncbi:MAG: hypothetical protein IJ916_10105 [Paludibacteraceae bacterium]|nr:hypothetical protein [Paludibacteraceae bacterium]